MSGLQVPEGVSPEQWTRLATDEGTHWAIRERNALGEVIGTARRFPDGTKGFEKGGKRGLILAWTLAPYAGTAADSPVLVCEGASDTAAAMTLGFDAVGVPMAGQCGDELATLLSGRHVCLVADDDEAGEGGTAKLMGAMERTAASVRVVLPMKPHKDLRAWAAAGATADELKGLVRGADPLERVKTPKAGDPILVRMDSVEPREVDWIWPGRIARGRLNLMAGAPGDGKSMLTMDITARVSRGWTWPDGSTCDAASVLLVSAEDDPADTIRPRLDAHGADCSRVHLMEGVQSGDATGRMGESLFSLVNLEPLERALEGHPDIGLVIIDPVGSFIGGRTDAHRDNAVREVLGPLKKVAERTGAGVLLIAHTRKGASQRADDAVLGSRGFTGIARVVLHVKRDPEEKTRRLLLAGKINIGKQAAGLAFTIDGDPARTNWIEGELDLTADDVCEAEASGEDRAPQLQWAKEWLLNVLADGEVGSAHLIAQAKEVGIKDSTLNRAKLDLGIKPRRCGFHKRWFWSLPEPEAGKVLTEGQDAQDNSLSTLGDAEHLAPANDDWGVI